MANDNITQVHALLNSAFLRSYLRLQNLQAAAALGIPLSAEEMATAHAVANEEEARILQALADCKRGAQSNIDQRGLKMPRCCLSAEQGAPKEERS